MRDSDTAILNLPYSTGSIGAVNIEARPQGDVSVPIYARDRGQRARRCACACVVYVDTRGVRAGTEGCPAGNFDVVQYVEFFPDEPIFWSLKNSIYAAVDANRCY
eukprot:CAMPEP_0198257030 /NCGR_PEP_ID=MMETSP1447-20131203/6804_1 /TAXON_ID=420782 /ORGANISM="Chaetoceros dichaeta, Strain CCMP1751" /LENGTH=104 /DNA_ID=CAMNT_0043943825 /DNA_START=220 /DNA_END=530 /DNA_ORIENTATION=+